MELALAETAQLLEELNDRPLDLQSVAAAQSDTIAEKTGSAMVASVMNSAAKVCALLCTLACVLGFGDRLGFLSYVGPCQVLDDAAKLGADTLKADQHHEELTRCNEK